MQTGGQFAERWHQWLAYHQLVPQVFVRVSSFTDLTRIVQAGHAAAVLPNLAAVDLDPKRLIQWPVTDLPPPKMVPIANTRSPDRSGIPSGIAPKRAALLAS